MKTNNDAILFLDTNVLLDDIESFVDKKFVISD